MFHSPINQIFLAQRNGRSPAKTPTGASPAQSQTVAESLAVPRGTVARLTADEGSGPVGAVVGGVGGAAIGNSMTNQGHYRHGYGYHPSFMNDRREYFSKRPGLWQVDAGVIKIGHSERQAEILPNGQLHEYWYALAHGRESGTHSHTGMSGERSATEVSSPQSPGRSSAWPPSLRRRSVRYRRPGSRPR
jgi:hypothetical protein